MNKIIKALRIIIRWLENRNVLYMVFGGIANSIYGNPRQTFDIDIKVLFDSPGEVEKFVGDISSIAKVIPDNPLKFIEETDVLPVEIETVRVDLVLAELSYEREVIKRSQYIDFMNIRMKVCPVEDFIIHKAVSTRSKDWGDIESVIQIQRSNLDWPYLLKHCKELAEFLDDQTLYTRIKYWKDAQ